jgi:recombination protein RecR
MPQLPEPIHNAAAAFDSLPGIGPRAALRYAFWLATQPKEAIQQFLQGFQGLIGGMHTCELCHQWTELPLCALCRDSRRDPGLVCVVATSQDLHAVEDTGAFKGQYHVLGGTIDPLEGRTPDKLTILHLVSRIKLAVPPVREVLLALDADVSGDTTSLFLRKQLEPLGVRVTKLARGLPTGAALEYADAHTLADAIEHRTQG